MQPHATCSGVAALSSGANILAWQGETRRYDYIPWQKASAGARRRPDQVDPRRENRDRRRPVGDDRLQKSVHRPRRHYHAADTASSVADTLIANATAPLQRQIDTLTRARAASDRAAATARDAQRLAEAAYQALFTKPIALTLAAKRFALGSGVVMVTGSPTDPVDVTLEIAKKKARKLGLSSNVIAEVAGQAERRRRGAADVQARRGRARSARGRQRKRCEGERQRQGRAQTRRRFPFRESDRRLGRQRGLGRGGPDVLSDPLRSVAVRSPAPAGLLCS